jgi:TPR repeat protein
VAEAALVLAECYEHGVGVTRHSHKAVGWYRRAADAGVPEAMYRLGLCYAKGDGVPQVTHVPSPTPGAVLRQGRRRASGDPRPVSHAWGCATPRATACRR